MPIKSLIMDVQQTNLQQLCAAKGHSRSFRAVAGCFVFGILVLASFILPFVVYILGAVYNQAQCLNLVKSSSTPDACPLLTHLFSLHLSSVLLDLTGWLK